MLTIAQICAFFIIANLPFLTITNILGIDTFIDSFHHPTNYLLIKNNKILNNGKNQAYLIVEKTTDNSANIQEGDVILYHSSKDIVQQGQVCQLAFEKGIMTYYTLTNTDRIIQGPLYNYQILGKITGSTDDTVWNVFCLQIWDLSINNLNAVALFSFD
jgi:hypothetical protein